MSCEIFPVTAGQECFSSTYLLVVPVPAEALGRCQPRLLVCCGFVPGAAGEREGH